MTRVRSRKAYRPSGFTLPRPLPWTSPLTRTSPEVMIVCWTVLTSLLLVWPKWPTLGLVAIPLILATVISRVPPKAVRIPPLWFWSGMIGGFIGASIGGGFWVFLRLCVLALLVLWGTYLLAWTFSTARLATALSHLIYPLKWIGAPVDEWAAMMALALKSLPTLGDQASAVVDTARLRMGNDLMRASFTTLVKAGIDIITACLSAASRSAVDTGRAMSLRGGTLFTREKGSQLNWPDLVVILIVVADIAGIVAMHLLV